jgi:SAM-dependent methyltransferase
MRRGCGRSARGRCEMAQLPYYRDVWVLSPETSSKTCPGRFPRGFINAVERRKWIQGRVLIPCSGDFRRPGAVHLDIRPETHPDIIGDVADLPFEDSTFDTVILDPPYSEKEANELYHLPYINLFAALNESSRVLRSGGNFLFLHRLLPQRHPQFGPEWRKMRAIALVGITTNTGFSNIRLLSVWRKLDSLAEFDAMDISATPQKLEQTASPSDTGSNIAVIGKEASP